MREKKSFEKHGRVNLKLINGNAFETSSTLKKSWKSDLFMQKYTDTDLINAKSYKIAFFEWGIKS